MASGRGARETDGPAAEAVDPRQLLRYWLGILKHEAAAQVGCIEAPEHDEDGAFAPDLWQPAYGRSYFELGSGGAEPLALADFLVQRRHGLTVEHLTARHQPFFEQDLRASYRRERLTERGLPAPDDSGLVVVGFPVVRFRESGRMRLAALLQIPVAVEWHDDQGKPWTAPARRERRGQTGAAPPSTCGLHSYDAEGLGIPYLLNEALLHRVAGLETEAVDALTEWLGDHDELRPEEMLAAITIFLREGEIRPEEALDTDHPPAQIDDLCVALDEYLRQSSRGSIARFAMVCDARIGVPTAQLQREMSTIVRSEELWVEPLEIYMGSGAPAPHDSPMRGLLSSRALTVAQRLAAETSLASTFTVVEGPPGTGKTDLILNLAADNLVRNVIRGVYDESREPPHTMVVASTNNQAVNQVVDPLGAWSGLPLALRVGNRKVMAVRSVSTLRDAVRWLEGADAMNAQADLNAAKERFQELLGKSHQENAASTPANQCALFEAALDVRDAWARFHSRELVDEVKRLSKLASGRHSWGVLLADAESRGLMGALFPVMGCTLLSMGNAWPLEPGVFDLLVIDEAGQCLPAYPVAALARCQRVLILGDTHQLEPVKTLPRVVERAILRDLGIPESAVDTAPYSMARDAFTSAQHLAEHMSHTVIRLRHHFRCQPDIIEISNRLVGYDLTVATQPRSMADRSQILNEAVTFVPVHGEQQPWYGSQRNVEEAETLCALVTQLRADGISPHELGILTPYRAQHLLLEQLLRRQGLDIDDWEHLVDLHNARLRPRGAVLGTIHRLQGGERDVVLLSTVATREPSIDWLNQRPNLLNVAVSRAKQHLLVVGHPQALTAGSYSRHLIPK